GCHDWLYSLVHNREPESEQSGFPLASKHDPLALLLGEKKRLFIRRLLHALPDFRQRLIVVALIRLHKVASKLEQIPFLLCNRFVIIQRRIVVGDDLLHLLACQRLAELRQGELARPGSIQTLLLLWGQDEELLIRSFLDRIPGVGDGLIVVSVDGLLK